MAWLEGKRSGAGGRCCVGDVGWAYISLAASVAAVDGAVNGLDASVVYEGAGDAVELGLLELERSVLSDMDDTLTCLCFCVRMPSKI